MTSWPDMDREAREIYLVVVQVKDMLGLNGGYSATTTVTISLMDVNDNGPTFQQSKNPKDDHDTSVNQTNRRIILNFCTFIHVKQGFITLF